MGALVARQPNGLLCRFSTVTYTVTHYDMTDEEYIEMCAEKARIGARNILENHLEPLSCTKVITQESFEEYIEMCAEGARGEARNILKGRFEQFGCIKEYFMDKVMTRESFEELLQEMRDKNSETQKKLSSIAEEAINIINSVYEEIDRISQKMSDKSDKSQDCINVHFCSYCKYYQPDKNTHICTNKKSENFNVNTAPFQHCNCFSESKTHSQGSD